MVDPIFQSGFSFGPSVPSSLFTRFSLSSLYVVVSTFPQLLAFLIAPPVNLRHTCILSQLPCNSLVSATPSLQLSMVTLLVVRVELNCMGYLVVLGRTGWLHWGQPNSLVGIYWMVVRDQLKSLVVRVRLVWG